MPDGLAARAWRTVRRGGSVGTPGVVESDGTTSLGTLAESLTVSSELGPQRVGTLAAALVLGSLAESLPVGAQAFTLAATATGAPRLSAGSLAAALTAQATGAPAVPLGSSGRSMTVSSTLTATGYATGTTQIFGTGWTSPGNANGAQDAASATITGAATATAAASGSGTLQTGAHTLAAAPTGFTRTKVELVVRQRIDTTVGALSSARAILAVQTGTGALTEVYRSQTPATGLPVNVRNDAALVTDTLDITAATAAWTDTQLRAIRVQADAAYDLLITTGGNFTWDLDAVHVRVTYTRSGIA